MKQTKGNKDPSQGIDQFSTFRIDGQLYGIDVVRVQEIVRSMPTTKVPLAKDFVRGLVNLRGQVATAIEFRRLLHIDEPGPEESMNVVCHTDGHLVSFVVDEINDVIQVSSDSFESPPHTIPQHIREMMDGVYKIEGELLSIINVDRVINRLAA